MALGIVQTAEHYANATGSGGTFDAGSNFTTGSTVFFRCSGWPGVFDAVTIGGVAATLDQTADAGTTDTYAVWRAKGAFSGKSVVTGTGPSYFIGDIIEVSDLATGGPQTVGSATGNSTTPAATCSTAATTADSLVLAGWSNGSDGQHSTAASTGFTHGFGNLAPAAEGGGGAHKIVASTATHTASFSGLGSAIFWACAVSSYAAAGGGGGSVSDPIESASRRHVRRSAVYRM